MSTNADIDKALHALKSTLQSQDPIDALSDELRIATRIKRYAEARYKHVIEQLPATIDVQSVRDQAASKHFKHEKQFLGAERGILVSCSAPAKRLDIDAFCNILIKQYGVPLDTINTAKANAEKFSAPATSYTSVEQG